MGGEARGGQLGWALQETQRGLGQEDLGKTRTQTSSGTYLPQACFL